MLKCAICGSLVQDDSPTCGVCGSSRLYGPGKILQPPETEAPLPTRRIGSWVILKTVLVLTISVGFLVGGFIFTFSEKSALFYLAGSFMIFFGGVALLAALSAFGGGTLRYRSRLRRSEQYSRWADLEQDKREKEKMSGPR